MNYRKERIERLLEELRYEFTRGLMEDELESETLEFRFIVPTSRVYPERGVVQCEFRTFPTQQYNGSPETKLRVVK